MGFPVIRGLVQFGQGALAARVSNSIVFGLRNDLCPRIQSLSFSYHDRTQAGQLMTGAASDVDRAQALLAQGAIMLVSGPLVITG